MKVETVNEKTPFFIESVEINAPKDFVFGFIDDYTKHKQWIKGLEDEKYNSVEGQVGSTFTQKIKMYGSEDEYQGKVLEYEAGKLYQIEVGDKWVDFKIEYAVEEISKETTLLTETAWILKGVSFYKLFKIIDRHILHEQLKRLKDIAETEYKKNK